MTKEEWAYLKLMEECAEVQQAASKLMQFGAYDVYKGRSNVDRLQTELNDLYAVIEMISKELGLYLDKNPDYIEHKREKLQKYLGYSQRLGRVDDDNGTDAGS